MAPNKQQGSPRSNRDDYVTNWPAVTAFITLTLLLIFASVAGLCDAPTLEL